MSCCNKSCWCSYPGLHLLGVVPVVTAAAAAAACPTAVTPPGHYTSNGTTRQCADGDYRAEWKPASLAGACVSCGINIPSTGVEQIAEYDVVSGQAASLDVRGSAGSCCEFLLITALC